MVVHGPVRNFGESIAMLDLDADGLSDLVVESGLGAVAVLYGSATLQGVLDLRDLGTGLSRRSLADLDDIRPLHRRGGRLERRRQG